MKDLKGNIDFANNLTDGFSLVDFWAPWCAPCRAMSPFLEQVEKSKSGQLAFYKVNVEEEENQDLAVNFQVRGIPMLAIFKGKIEIARNVGAFSNAKSLEDWIDGVLKNQV